MSHEQIIQTILQKRGLNDPESRRAFLLPDYATWKHDAFLLPDMRAAVDRIKRAKAGDELVYIYGDYDIDGLTATTVLLEALTSFGIRVEAFIPNRFNDGYGLSRRAMDELSQKGAQLIITVDCGSLSHKEIAHANRLGMDVVVTDHHSVAETMPEAIATINPKRTDHKYPFVDLAGVGVAFKLVQALQTELDGLPDGQEKWLLDLVALGTVCDVVSLRDENRANVRWGLEVMKKTRRVGIKALMAVSGVTPATLTARSLGFGLGPRLNAAGRLETAILALDLLCSTDPVSALELANQLDEMNKARRVEQDRIFAAATGKADELANDPVLIVSDPSWSHGIIGIVAAKLLERYYKPAFVLQELADGSAKGSARSFGDFSAVEGIKATEHLLIKGGGHKLAAGVTLRTENISAWRRAMNNFYKGKKLENQLRHLLPEADVTLEGFGDCDESLIREITRLEPYGNGNREPVFCITPVNIISRRVMGAEQQHVKYTFSDGHGKTFQAIAFNAADKFSYEAGEVVSVWIELSLNEWQGRLSVEGRLLRLELT